MADIRVPTLGESVTEATVGKWFKQPGDAVAVDEPLVELETDKVTLEVPAPAAGVLSDVAVKAGDTVAVGALLGQITGGAGAAGAKSSTATKPAASSTGAPDEKTAKTKPIGAGPENPQPREMPPAAKPSEMPIAAGSPAPSSMPVPPSVRKMAAESGVDPGKVEGSGVRGQVTKGDMMAAIE
ncbi:MAG TPA: biotin/lipoyl-containing protein, partial [Pseudolabrys sp.]|nr:biotin/lipoyl-containing protein [Pseudolabrys sp.]